MIELFANYRINNPRSSGDVSNGNEGKLKCMVNKHFPVFFQARILPGNWELPALMDTLAGAGWRLLKENLRCAAERFFTHERREPSVPRRGRRKSTVNKHFHRFFCRLPFAWKGREPAPHGCFLSQTRLSRKFGLPCFVAERRENLLHQEQKLTIYGVWTREISRKRFSFRCSCLTPDC